MSDKEEIELRECPRCEGIDIRFYSVNNPRWAGLYCPNCFYTNHGYSHNRDAIKAWNARIISPTMKKSCQICGKLLSKWSSFSVCDECKDKSSPTMKKEIELLPCPFCGAEDPIRGEMVGATAGMYRFRVHCSACNCYVGNFKEEKEADEAWNVRTPSPTMKKEWPEKKTIAEDETQWVRRHKEGWNACHDAFRAVINEHSKLWGMDVKADPKLKGDEFKIEHDCGCGWGKDCLAEEAKEKESRVKEIEGLLHRCLDPYVPPVVQDTNQSFKYIAEAIDGMFGTPPAQKTLSLEEVFKRMEYVLYTDKTISGEKPDDKSRLEMIEHIINDVRAIKAKMDGER